MSNTITDSYNQNYSTLFSVNSDYTTTVETMIEIDDEKRILGSFYTQGNPFKFKGFKEWFSQISENDIILEPFAGDKQIRKLLNEAGYERKFKFYDADSKVKGVIHKDTILDFPKGFKVVLTNPPYLSYHFAVRKKLNPDKNYFKGYESLYLTSIYEALKYCDFVGMIIPDSFLTTGLFRERLQHIISLPCDMFDDTDMPVCLALWGPKSNNTFKLWENNKYFGNSKILFKNVDKKCNTSKITFNSFDGTIGLLAIDNSKEASIAFCKGADIPDSKVVHSGRLITRIKIDNVVNEDEIIKIANVILNDWREKTKDKPLTAFKGLREDGRFRRRLDFKNARTILENANCIVSNHKHKEK